ncbi:MAG: TatD family hydrolase [Candidatus Moraniibacteriota bacterium]
MLFDTHAHVNFNAFREDADEVLRRALEAGISVVNVGSQLSTSRRAIEYAKKFEGQGVYAAIGLHPIQLRKRSFEHRDDENDWELPSTEIKTIGEGFDYDAYLEIARDPHVVAIGEVGLDYHHFEDGDDVEAMKEEQKRILREFVRLANEVGKPMMIHCWGVKSSKLDHARTAVIPNQLDHARTDAYDDLLALFDETAPEKRGVIHSFIGSHKTAKKFLDRGWNIGINGIVTYSDSYDRLIREVPLQRIVVETDCPYLAPVPQKGERNEPLLVRLVVEKIAFVKGIPFDETARVTTDNARMMLGIR